MGKGQTQEIVTCQRPGCTTRYVTTVQRKANGEINVVLDPFCEEHRD